MKKLRGPLVPVLVVGLNAALIYGWYRLQFDEKVVPEHQRYIPFSKDYSVRGPRPDKTENSKTD